MYAYLNHKREIGYPETIKVDGNRWELNTFFVEWQSLMASGSETSDNPSKKIKNDHLLDETEVSPVSEAIHTPLWYKNTTQKIICRHTR